MTNFVTKLKTGIAIGAMVVGTMMGAEKANADFIYHYIGNSFTFADSSPYSTTQHVEITFTTAAALNNNMIHQDISGLLLSYEASIIDTGGPFFTLSSGAPGVSIFFFNIGTNASTVPTSWGISLLGNSTCPPVALLTDCSIQSFYEDTMIVSDTDQTTLSFADSSLLFATNFSMQGQWSVTDTSAAPSPEVTGLMLGGLGLMGFAALRRK